MNANVFDDLHRAMRAQVDQEFLPCVSTVLLRGREVVDRFHYGFADREAGIALREDHIFRIFSNTKLATSCAMMMLVEKGEIGLDDPIGQYLPELTSLQVLRPGAIDIGDTEPATGPITIRHLMTHTSGLSYGVFDPGSLLFAAYNQAGVLNPATPLADMVTRLARLPLSFQPGTRWEYSVATDVLGRVLEVVTGKSFGQVLASWIFEPLGMVDTGFWVPDAKHDRLCALYQGVDLLDPTKPGLVRIDEKPYPGAYRRKVPRESGGGGLVSTLGDWVRFVQSLMPGGPRLLREESLASMFTNQLPFGVWVEFRNMPRFENLGFGLGSAVTTGPMPGAPSASKGEVGWGGNAGTIWWIHPGLNIAAVLMTQRYFGFGNPYTLEFKRQAYRALGV